MTNNEIIQKVKNHLNLIKLDFDDNADFYCRDKEFAELRDKTKKEIYTVSFKTPDYIERNKNGEIISLIEGYPCWCKLDAETFEILYYIKPHGYIEPDGTGHWI